MATISRQPPCWAKPLRPRSASSYFMKVRPLPQRKPIVLEARKREDSSKGSGKSLNLGLAEVVDDGWDIKIRIGSAKISVPKTEVVGYAAPVVGLAVVGIIGALLLGPAIVSFMMVAGAVIASVSAFSALLVAVFIIPAAIGLVFTFASVAGGLAVGASTLAIVFGAVALMGSLLMKTVEPSSTEGNEADKSVAPAKDKWLESYEADQERIDEDLDMFDQRLKDLDR